MQFTASSICPFGQPHSAGQASPEWASEVKEEYRIPFWN
jgi:hypothetical protein